MKFLTLNPITVDNVQLPTAKRANVFLDSSDGVIKAKFEDGDVKQITDINLLPGPQGPQGPQGDQGPPGTTDHLLLTNIGANSHDQIDDHISNTLNPHSITAEQVGLGNADNTSDLNKPISTATQNALNLKENIFNPNNESIFFDDFFIGSTTALGWQQHIAGSGSGASTGTYGIGSAEKPMGIIRLSTGTSTGRSAISRANNGLIFGYATSDQIWRIALENLGSEIENFVVYVGFHDAVTAGAPTDGVYFVYASTLGPNWLCITRNNNVQTTIDSGVPANLNYNVFKNTVNESGTEVNFFINDVLVGTSTTNIPNTFNRRFGPTCKIESLTGTSPKILNADYYYEKFTFTGGRS